jgi:uncharacterized protein (DUF433 family)
MHSAPGGSTLEAAWKPLEGMSFMAARTRPVAKGDVPGIVVSRRPEQTARIVGTGIEVWEVYKTFIEVDYDRVGLQLAYDWLTEKQLDAALTYAAANLDAILDRIREDYSYLPENERPSI